MKISFLQKKAFFVIFFAVFINGCGVKDSEKDFPSGANARVLDQFLQPFSNLVEFESMREKVKSYKLFFEAKVGETDGPKLTEGIKKLYQNFQKVLTDFPKLFMAALTCSFFFPNDDARFNDFVQFIKSPNGVEFIKLLKDLDSFEQPHKIRDMCGLLPEEIRKSTSKNSFELIGFLDGFRDLVVLRKLDDLDGADIITGDLLRTPDKFDLRALKKYNLKISNKRYIEIINEGNNRLLKVCKEALKKIETTTRFYKDIKSQDFGKVNVGSNIDIYFRKIGMRIDNQSSRPKSSNDNNGNLEEMISSTSLVIFKSFVGNLHSFVRWISLPEKSGSRYEFSGDVKRKILNCFSDDKEFDDKEFDVFTLQYKLIIKILDAVI